MERNHKLTVNVPQHLIEAMGITEDTEFEIYFAEGKLHISALDEADIKLREIEDESAFEDGYEEGFREGEGNGRMEGYDKGYRYGYSDAILGKRFNPEIQNAEVFLDTFDCDVDGCEECELFDRKTGRCTLND
jgi:flagellar biosynthesis/type III secretory pathway protein FliH